MAHGRTQLRRLTTAVMCLQPSRPAPFLGRTRNTDIRAYIKPPGVRKANTHIPRCRSSGSSIRATRNGSSERARSWLSEGVSRWARGSQNWPHGAWSTPGNHCSALVSSGAPKSLSLAVAACVEVVDSRNKRVRFWEIWSRAFRSRAAGLVARKIDRTAPGQRWRLGVLSFLFCGGFSMPAF